MKFLGLALGLIFQLNSFGQAWDCDTLVVIVKTTDHIAIHSFGAVYNYSGQDIDMHWEANFRSVPSAWEIYLDDPSAPYDTIQSGDEKDFVLSGSVDPQFPEKMIFGMDHANTTGHGWVDYKIYPVADPTDTLHMIFDITINPGLPSAIAERDDASDVMIWHESGQIQLRADVNSLRAYNLQGQLVWTVAPNGRSTLQVPAHLRGLLVLEAQQAGLITRKKVLRR